MLAAGRPNSVCSARGATCDRGQKDFSVPLLIPATTLPQGMTRHAHVEPSGTPLAEGVLTKLTVEFSQPSSNVVIPYTAFRLHAGAVPAYMRAVSNTLLMPYAFAIATARSFGIGTSRKTESPAGTAPQRLA